jgi:hypothetical protein
MEFAWDASACAPGDVRTFRPGDYVPASPPLAACPNGVTDIQALYDKCLGKTAKGTDCYDWATANAACFQCVITKSTDASYGPVIDYGGFVEANVAGCIETVSHGTSCAKSVQALTSCQLASCLANCPVTDAPSLASFTECTTQAELGGCQAYASQASCFTSAADAGPLSLCASEDFEQFLLSVAPLFCAPPFADADAPGLLDSAAE